MPIAFGPDVRSALGRAFGITSVVLCLAGCATPGPERSFRDEARRQPDRAACVRRVPPVSNFRAHGDLAPLAAALAFWGKPVRPGDWGAVGGDTAISPPDEETLVQAVWKQGLWAYPSSSSMERAREWIRLGIPVVVRLRESQRTDAGAYDALVIAFSDNRDSVLVDSRSSGRTVMPLSDFLPRWRATDHRALVISPPEVARRELGPEEYLFRARFHEASGQADAAARDYEAALAAGLSTPLMLVSLGNLYRTLDRSAEAELLYRRAIRDDPRMGRAYNNLAYLLAEEGRELDEAVRLARQALVLDPANPLFMDTLGLALLRRQQYREAADVLERAWGRSRWHPTRTQIEIGLHLALAHFHGGQESLAEEVLRDVLSLDPQVTLPDELKRIAAPR